jgi:hypothetical protein
MEKIKIEGKAQQAGAYRPLTKVRVFERAVIGRFPQFMLSRPKPAKPVR